jgi:DNA-binding NarL/FixJ family response regulator
VSPRLKIHFVVEPESLALYHPNGEAFTTYDQVIQQRNQAEQARANAEQARENAVHRLFAMGLSKEQVAEALGFSPSQVQEIAERISGD